jgi:hypothetical protein
MDGHSVLGDCASRQHNHLIDRFIGIKTMLSRWRFLDVITNPVDDVSGAIDIAYDTAERFPDLAEAADSGARDFARSRCAGGFRAACPGRPAKMTLLPNSGSGLHDQRQLIISEVE